MNKNSELTKGVITSNDLYDTKEETYNNKDVNYWRGFRELYNDPEFRKEVESEFDDDAGKPFDTSKLSAISRRKFLALLSASAAVAAAGCSNYRDKGEIVPFNQKPENLVEGNPNYFASTFQIGGEEIGVLVKSREGRPIKVNGNPEHPVSKGKANLAAQATVLALYDPDRIREPKASSDKNSFSTIQWNDADAKIIETLRAATTAGKEISIFTSSVISPTQRKLFDDFIQQFPTTKIYPFEQVNNSVKNSAWNKIYGQNIAPAVKWDEAKVIVALECDFLGLEDGKTEAMRLFAKNRDLINNPDNYSRLYSIEGSTSLTGLNSDYRLRLRTDAIEELILALVNEFGVKRGGSALSLESGIVSKVSSFNINAVAEKYGLDKEVIGHLVKDLDANRGTSIFVAGASLPESTQISTYLLNEILGNTKLYSFDFKQDLTPLSTTAELADLSGKMKGGQVGVFINFDSNPVFDLPRNLGMAEAIMNVETVISFTEIDNETSIKSNYVLPCNNPLESWGDYNSRISYFGLQQPLIAPLFNTRQKEAVMLNWMRGGNNFNESIYHQYLKDNWQQNLYPILNASASFNDFWFDALHDGFVLLPSQTQESLQFNQSAVIQAQPIKPSGGKVVLLTRNYTLGDGKYSNNGWLQELPHPVSKIVWDNYAAISLATATANGLDSNDLVNVSIGDRTVTLPVFVQPSMADDVIAIELGCGRSSGGKVSEGTGFDVVPLIGNDGISPWVYNNASISKATGTYELVSTQEHYPIDSPKFKDIQFKRRIIQQGTYKQFKSNPKDIVDRVEVEGIDLREFPSINGEPIKYTGVKWAMAIDLNKCTGCGECIMSCNVENNIPVVGKDQVANKRAMQWIRLDRYYFGTPEDARANFQPMLCQHCDFAPCENVCPVVATTHSEDGLNGMTYNRCVGTRYCANNCPYKVRRFNYFNFRHEFKDYHYHNDSMQLAMNPEVTVRSRGVMEKCTFCVQRVMKARQDAISANRELKGTDVITACQEACPANAITFGDMNDKSDPIQAYRNSDIAFYSLEEVKVRPNVTYISQIFNIEEEVPKAGHHND